MVNTRQSNTNNVPLLPNPNPSHSVSTPTNSSDLPSTELLSQQLSAIMAKLNNLDTEMTTLKQQKSFQAPKGNQSHSGKQIHEVDDEEHDNLWWKKNPSKRPHSKVEFPKFEGGDPRGWVMKAEKYFRYYQTPEDLKVDVAAMNLEGDALDVFTWVSSGRSINYWDDLIQIFQEHFGPAEFQNPDVYLCSIKQLGSVQEYRQEFVRRSSRVHGWPKHCLLGVFINGLKEELQSDVKIQKPRTVYKAASLALEFEAKLQNQNVSRYGQRSGVTCGSESSVNFKEDKDANIPRLCSNSALVNAPVVMSSFNTQKQLLPTTTGTSQRMTHNATISDHDRKFFRDKRLCFKCGDKFVPGHKCQPASLKLMEITEEVEDPHLRAPDSNPSLKATQFPTFCLEDKAYFLGESNDRVQYQGQFTN
ncbi:uncharacterized protein LOC114757959 [Neltuma alba]|uniref:uncharacterized protein LOC114757959 n=1 Tax=Neltuma alba TaxID=207710 RepID=UPI0010A37772|nr:uncharacterized protein LOC114757959 [Prosopis alba]